MKKLGRYEIGERIGQGAMADVYRAHDPSINRPLAIKVLKPEFRQNRQYAARFLREAKAAGALSHPNIVTIYDVGEEDGYPYIVMEHLEGETLDSVTQRGLRLDAAVAAEIGIQLAEALSYAHGLGVVHRDVKPSNIMLGRNGRSVKLLDFGIAWLAEAAGAEDNQETLHTQVGQVLGTPRYMSPEQALGKEADGRADLFSVGVVLYELLSGRRAFGGANPAVLALQIIQAEPEPLAKAAPDTPRGLQFIVEKLLSKRPERRFADGAQLAMALRREQGDARPARGGPRALPLPIRMALAMGAITALALCLSVGVVLQRQDEALRRMAITSGAAIANFVASNAAVTAVDNAGLPPGQGDWLPAQAFVKAAAQDPNVKQITVVDSAGVVRASTNAGRVGQVYAPPSAEPVVSRQDGLTVTDAAQPADAFRFSRPITYAGRAFGRVDVSLDKSGLDAASGLSRLLLGFLALVTLGVVIVVSYLEARAIASPLRKLKRALADAAGGDLDFRLSHKRRDEFGDLFDAFNALAASFQTRLEAAAAKPATMAQIEGPAPPAPALASPGASDAAGDELDRTLLASEAETPLRRLIRLRRA